MKIVIVGIGKLGKTLTKSLVEEKHNIVIIDKDEEIIEETVNDYDVLGYSGNGASYDVLVESGAKGADLLIASTSQDEVNILCCLVAKKLKIKQTIARVRNPEYAKQLSLLNEELGISTIINPDQDTANEIVRTLQFPTAIKIETFANKKVNLVEVKLEKNSPLNGKTLIQMKEKYPFEGLVCAVQRGEEVFIPRGDFVLQENDNIHIAGSARELVNLFKKIDIYKSKLKSCMILGGSKIGYYVARELLKSSIAVKIVDEKKERCEELADLLPGATIIHGDCTDHSLLLEEGIQQIDSVVTLTGMDETNIILSTYCRKLEVPKIITKINNENYRAILGSIRLDSIVSPKEISSDIIVRYVRGIETSEGNDCKTMYHLVGNKIEAQEFIVSERASFISKQLKDIQMKPNVLLACIIREGVVIIPSGRDTIEAADTIIIIAPHSTVKTVEDILR